MLIGYFAVFFFFMFVQLLEMEEDERTEKLSLKNTDNYKRLPDLTIPRAREVRCDDRQ